MSCTMSQNNDKIDANEPEIKVPCEVYSRIVGYLRPVNMWNDGKQAEYDKRRTFDSALKKEKDDEENHGD